MSVSKSKKNVATSQQNAPAESRGEKEYATEKLLKSKHLAGYQRDFAKAILTKSRYTVKEAQAALDAVLKPKTKGDE